MFITNCMRPLYIWFSYFKKSLTQKFQLYSNRTSCCPSRKWICSHDANEGISCGTPSKRFYFDANTETCHQFTYLGCAGNANSFSNRVACYQFCQSACKWDFLSNLQILKIFLACSSSEVIYQPSNLDEPFDCSLKTCPRHFSCVKSVWDETKNVCCGSPNFGVCSSTQHPMLLFSTQQPMTCTPNSQVKIFSQSGVRTLLLCVSGIPLPCWATWRRAHRWGLHQVAHMGRGMPVPHKTRVRSPAIVSCFYLFCLEFKEAQFFRTPVR